MSERLTKILGYVTLFAILAAIWVLFGEDPARQQGGRGEKLFPGLAAQINTVTGLSLSGPGGQVSLNKDSDGWRVKERGGYRADTDKINAFLRGLAVGVRRDPKTDRPKSLPKIGLGDKATFVTLTGADGAELASLSLGTRRQAASGKSLTYVYRESDTRSWLVSHIAAFESTPAWWLDRSVLTLDSDQTVALDLGPVAFVRAEAGAPMTLDDTKDGEEPGQAWKIQKAVSAVTRLAATDVRKTANPLSDPLRVITVQQADGLRVRLTLFSLEGENWAMITASNNADGGGAPDKPDAVFEAEKINQQAAGWLYRLPSTDAQTLLAPRAYFMADSGLPAVK